MLYSSNSIIDIAAAIASKGHVVIGVDRDKGIVNKINAGISPVKEAYLQNTLDVVGDNLTATTDLRSALTHADVVGIMVATRLSNQLTRR